jgi:hypothetical protein
MYSFEVNIMCDGSDDNCSSIVTGEPADIPGGIESAKREALANHWIRVKRKGKWLWLCPYCQPMDKLLHSK